MSDIVLGTFAGNGWSEACRALGIDELGIELDAAACATRRAAGHLTVRADVSKFPVEQIAGKTWGQTHSPPCVVFSAAGDRAGNAITGHLAALTRDLFAGRATRGAHRRAMVHALRVSNWFTDVPASTPPGAVWLWSRKDQDAWKRRLLARKDSRARRLREQMTASNLRHPRRAERSARIWAAVRSASLVAEPARFIRAGRPEWVTLEQVPAVLPLWEVYAAELRQMGYSTWTGTLNSADYGVPQKRIRAILIASRVRQVARPEPTHYDTRKGLQLWGTPWVSMADALGWGATVRPVPTVTAGGTNTGGAEPFGHRGRDALEAERDAGQWALRIDTQANASVQPASAPAPASAPTPTLKFGHSAAEMQWVLHTNRDQRPDGTRQTVDASTAPAPALTAKSGGQWIVKAAWASDRPATTLQCDQRVFGPHAGSKGESQSSNSVRITVEEAAILQSFRPDYPWQGTETARFRQVGDAVPPLLATHILAVATGLPLPVAAPAAPSKTERAA